MANRDRIDPHRSAQQGIFRGAGQGRGNQLGAEGGEPGSDIGSTKPLRIDERNRSVDNVPPRRPRGGKQKG